MEKGRVLTAGTIAGALTGMAALILFALAAACAAMDSGNPWEGYYNHDHGGGRADIRNHFNLHRGRWWNYYYRGSLYLAYGHYEDALNDFATAIAKRSGDSRDARTYGMHFIDYFSHRESGVAYYFQAGLATNDKRREECYKSAIEQLEASLRQEESARAKSYLSRARRAFWQVTERRDSVAPSIHVKRPIYANRRRIRFAITVRDDDSYVGDIRIDRSAGDVRIDRTSFFVELPERQITKTVDLTLGPEARMAVVVITASDLAGNQSEPNRALIILDTEAPTANLSVVRDEPPTGGLAKILIDAQDDFGLKQIEVGQEPAGKVECDGALRYSGVVAGMARNGKLRVVMVDDAGNRTAASIPLSPDGGQDRLAAASSSPAHSWMPLMDAPRRLSWSPALWAAHLPRVDGVALQRSIPLYRAAGARVTPLTVARGRIREQGPPEFDLEEYTEPPDGPKETSERSFTVEGVLWNPLSINRIKVQLNEQQKEDVWEQRRDRDCDCHILRPLSVDLSDVAIGETQIVKVQAYRKDAPCVPPTPKFLRVKRVKDVSRDDDARYGLLLLPLSSSKENGLNPPGWSLGWGPSEISEIYEAMLHEIGSLTMFDRLSMDESEASLDAFRVYDINDVYGISSEEWYKNPKSTYAVYADLRSWRKGDRGRGPRGIDPRLIDLIVYGNLSVRAIINPNDPTTKDVDIELRAVDVATSDGRDLRFPLDGGRTEAALAQMTCRGGNVQDVIKGVWSLAGNVAKVIPRLHTDDVWVDGAGDRNAKWTVRFGLGERDGVFRYMKLWLYQKDAPKNAKLTKIACPNLPVNRGFDSSSIECDRKLSASLSTDCDYIVITK